ncbi:FMN-dependent NADH-azoreductase, partial [Marinosulfonomonas sp. PRT-SC04]
MTNHILRIDASLRHTDSITRELLDRITARFDDATITTRDLAAGLPLIDEAWIGANFTAPDERTETQNTALAFSDSLIDELAAADTLLLGLPIYNFTVPTAFKAWIDQIARVGRTFHYTDTRPVG